MNPLSNPQPDREDIEAILTFVSEAEYLNWAEALRLAAIRSDIASYTLEDDCLELCLPS